MLYSSNEFFLARSSIIFCPLHPILKQLLLWCVLIFQNYPYMICLLVYPHWAIRYILIWASKYKTARKEHIWCLSCIIRIHLLLLDQLHQPAWADFALHKPNYAAGACMVHSSIQTIKIYAGAWYLWHNRHNATELIIGCLHIEQRILTTSIDSSYSLQLACLTYVHIFLFTCRFIYNCGHLPIRFRVLNLFSWGLLSYSLACLHWVVSHDVLLSEMMLDRKSVV